MGNPEEELKAKARELVKQAEESDAERKRLYQQTQCIYRTINEHIDQMNNIVYIASILRYDFDSSNCWKHLGFMTTH